MELPNREIEVEDVMNIRSNTHKEQNTDYNRSLRIPSNARKSEKLRGTYHNPTLGLGGGSGRERAGSMTDGSVLS